MCMGGFCWCWIGIGFYFGRVFLFEIFFMLFSLCVFVVFGVYLFWIIFFKMLCVWGVIIIIEDK